MSSNIKKKYLVIISFVLTTIPLLVSCDSYTDGYNWAADNGIEEFSECDEEFGASAAEDGCNEYVQEQLDDGPYMFKGDSCTEDCSGHEAGYEWADENGINDESDCDGTSNSFNEGCAAYVRGL